MRSKILVFLCGVFATMVPVGFGSFWLGNQTGTSVMFEVNGELRSMNGGLYYCELVGKYSMILLIGLAVIIGILWLMGRNRGITK